MTAALLLCLTGLAALVGGAELLVRAGTRLAALAGVPPVLVGLTVVALGTSMPELAIGIEAALGGNGSLTVGNIAGANIFNILFTFGLSALIWPLNLEIRSLRVDLPVMVAAAVLLLALSWDGRLTRADGAILVTCGVLYTVFLVRQARRESRAVIAEFAEEYPVAPPRERRDARAILRSAALLAVSMAVIVAGADWLVEGAVGLARMTGVSEAYIGLTVVAVGTSSPELVTTIVSTLRQQRDIAIGNLLGSSVFNILLILGVVTLVPAQPIAVETALTTIAMPVMIAAAVLCIPVFLSGRRVSRPEGGLLVSAYLAYLLYLVFTLGEGI